MKKILFSCAVLLALSACSKSEDKTKKKEPEKETSAACAEIQRVKREVKINPKQYKPYGKKGKSSIFGRFCVNDVNDENTICLKGQLVVLNPVTDYSTEWYLRNWGGNEALEEAHEIAKAHNKIVYTNENGDFSFDELPPGEYYVGGEFSPCKIKLKDFVYKYGRYGFKATVGKNEKKQVILEKLYQEQ